MQWAEQSISINENYTNLSTKSDLLVDMDKDNDATDLKNLALEHQTTKVNDFYSYGTSLVRMGKAEEAMEIYQRQSEKWPDEWLTAHGLARGYSANGDYQTALKYERDALNNAPDANKGFIESAIIMLEQGKDFN